MKTTLACVLAVLLCFAMVCGIAGCDEAPIDEGTGNVALTPVNFGNYPENFDDWSLEDMVRYMKDCGVFIHEDWFLQLTGGDVNACQCTAAMVYFEATAFEVYDRIFFFDPASGDNVKAAADYIRETKIMAVAPPGQPIPIDYMIGNFAFQYELGISKDHKTLLQAALDQLSEHFNIQPAY